MSGFSCHDFVLGFFQDWTLICNILLEDDGAGEDSLAPEDKAMLSKFLVAALKIAKDDPRTENRSKVKGKKVLPL